MLSTFQNGFVENVNVLNLFNEKTPHILCKLVVFKYSSYFQIPINE